MSNTNMPVVCRAVYFAGSRSNFVRLHIIAGLYFYFVLLCVFFVGFYL